MTRGVQITVFTMRAWAEHYKQALSSHPEFVAQIHMQASQLALTGARAMCFGEPAQSHASVLALWRQLQLERVVDMGVSLRDTTGPACVKELLCSTVVPEQQGALGLYLDMLLQRRCVQARPDDPAVPDERCHPLLAAFLAQMNRSFEREKGVWLREKMPRGVHSPLANPLVHRVASDIIFFEHIASRLGRNLLHCRTAAAVTLGTSTETHTP